MATMNKPGLNDGNWYQAVTDNWTSIENNIVDKSALSAKGDLLVGTGVSAPSRLAVGSDAFLLTPDGAQAGGLRWEPALDMANALLLKSFFRNQSLLPSTVVKETLYTWPASDFANLNGNTFSTSMSRAKFTPGPAGAINFGWSLGGTYSKVLMIVGGIRPLNDSTGILICNTLPSAPNPADGYFFADEPTALRIYKSNGGGSYTKLAEDTAIFTDPNYSAVNCALAAYVDGTANRLVLWARMGSESWNTVLDITDSTLTSFKYAGILAGNSVAGDRWLICPLGIYAQ